MTGNGIFYAFNDYYASQGICKLCNTAYSLPDEWNIVYTLGSDFALGLMQRERGFVVYYLTPLNVCTRQYSQGEILFYTMQQVTSQDIQQSEIIRGGGQLPRTSWQPGVSQSSIYFEVRMFLTFPLCTKTRIHKRSVIMPCAVADLAALNYHRQATIHIQPSADGLRNNLVLQSLVLHRARK